MAKKKKTRTASPPSRSESSTPAQLARELEKKDRELLKALNDRAKLAQKLAKTQNSAEQEVDTSGEDSLITRLLQAHRGPLGETTIRTIFRELLSGTRALIKPQRVAYLGPKYSYSYLAAVERFGTGVELAPVATIAAVFDELNRQHADYGVVPLENSTDGRVADTLDMFSRVSVKICGEILLPIHHNLLAVCPREGIKEVYSKPQALSQCRQWLARHLPWARTVEMTSTAAAAQLAAGKDGAAAIASIVAASNYGLNVLASNIEDNPNNVTRFAVIGGETAKRTGRDKTAVMFEIPHQPGALSDVMSVFKRSRLNLTWIESFPISGSDNEYLFFVEMDGHQNDAKVRKALDSLARKTIRCEILGSYARSQPVT